MSRHRRAAKIDNNQSGIVSALRAMPGVTVELNHDDVLVGYGGKTFWYEIKDPQTAFNKDGTFRKGSLKPSQIKLRAEWAGHYKIVWSLEMILTDMGINS